MGVAGGVHMLQHRALYIIIAIFFLSTTQKKGNQLPMYKIAVIGDHSH